jgi:hypothetical protein
MTPVDRSPHPASSTPTPLERASGERASRSRALLVVVLALCIVAAGASARIASTEHQPARPAVAASAVAAASPIRAASPVVAASMGAPEAPLMSRRLPAERHGAPVPMRTLGDDGLIGGVPGALRPMPAAPDEPVRLATAPRDQLLSLPGREADPIR